MGETRERERENRNRAWGGGGGVSFARRLGEGGCARPSLWFCFRVPGGVFAHFDSPILPSKWSIPTLFPFSFAFTSVCVCYYFLILILKAIAPPPSLCAAGLWGSLDAMWAGRNLFSTLPFLFPMCFFLFPGWSQMEHSIPPPPSPSLNNSLPLDTPHFAISNSKTPRKEIEPSSIRERKQKKKEKRGIQGGGH